jgi:hypothetical protein
MIHTRRPYTFVSLKAIGPHWSLGVVVVLVNTLPGLPGHLGLPGVGIDLSNLLRTAHPSLTSIRKILGAATAAMNRTGSTRVLGFDVAKCITPHNQLYKQESNIIQRSQLSVDISTCSDEEEASYFESYLSEPILAFLDGIDIVANACVSFTPEFKGICQHDRMLLDGGSLYPDLEVMGLYDFQDDANGKGLVFDLNTNVATFIEGVGYSPPIETESSETPRFVGLALEQVLQTWWDRRKYTYHLQTTISQHSRCLSSRRAGMLHHFDHSTSKTLFKLGQAMLRQLLLGCQAPSPLYARESVISPSNFSAKSAHRLFLSSRRV